MSQRRPPLPRRADACSSRDLLRFVRSEDELDALLAFVERTSLPPELPVEPRLFEPAPVEDMSERLDLEPVMQRLSSAPAPAGMMHARRITDPGLAGRRVDIDAVLEGISLTPSVNLRPSNRAPAPVASPFPSWPRIATVAMAAFMLGSALTYIAG